MLAYDCKNCKKIILWGRVNEFDEYFCNEKCYLDYCYSHGYKPNVENLKYIK